MNTIIGSHKQGGEKNSWLDAIWPNFQNTNISNYLSQEVIL